LDKYNFDLMLFSGRSNPQLAEQIAAYLKKKLGKLTIKQFSDEELYVKIDENIRGRDVYLIQSTCKPANDNLMELLMLIDAARRASAGRITAVIPYYGYARQDRKVKSREAITARLVANLLEKAGTGRVMTVDLHSGQIQGFFNVPLDNLSGFPLLIDYVKSKKLKNLAVVAPDAGAAKNVTKIAKALNSPLAIINKSRPKENVAEALNIIGDVKGKQCVIFDDMIDTAGTISVGAKALKKEGATKVIVCATHGIFSGPAIERIEEAPFDEVVVTDSIPANGNKSKKIKVLSIAKLVGEAIRRTHCNESVSSLFEYGF